MTFSISFQFLDTHQFISDLDMGLRLNFQFAKYCVEVDVTRSIGDDDLKPGVTAELEVTETVLSDEDEYVNTDFTHLLHNQMPYGE
ncbi:hypothetical protein L6452_34338 [Arctium lappa]|uniref:Uncharacterized protein n=1 Tax=Arctium lappa TaxID=4217 RepID=A0ACB8YJI2_ARCLA|nr:hypothetical protein L6452_34338 [Arctium lappa]